MDVLTHQIHSDRGANGSDVPGFKVPDNFSHVLERVFFGEDHFVVSGVNKVRDLLGVGKIDGSFVETHRESHQRLLEHVRGDATHERRIEASGQKITHRHIRHQALAHTFDQAVADFCENFLLRIFSKRLHLGDDPERLKISFAVVVVARRKGVDFVAEWVEHLEF